MKIVKLIIVRVRRLPLVRRYLGLRQFVKFSIVGFSSTILDFGVYIILTRAISLQYLWANFIALVAGATLNFTFNKTWTFRNHDRKFYWQYVKFWIVAILGLVASQYLLYFFVARASIYDILAKALAALIIMCCRFLAHKYWIFKFKP